MTAINFPNDPKVGDTFLNFAWDGEKWQNAGSRASAIVFKDLFEFNVAGDDSTQRTIHSGESVKFIGSGTVTTASDAEGNITISGAATNLTGYATETFVTTRGYLTSVGTISYNDLSNKPTIPSLTGYATETFVTTRGYLTSVGTISYNDLSNKPTIPSLTGYATETFVTTRGYLTSVGTISYTDLSNKPSLFSGSYTDLTSKPTIPTTVTVNGTAITLGSSGTVTADASTLSGTELKSTVVTSSLTSLGTLTSLTSSGAVSITNNTNSSSITTGALKIAGGVGIGGKLYVGDSISAGAIDGTNITASGTLKANNGILGTTQTTAYVFNDTATTVNIGGSASTISLGYSGTLTIGNSTVVGTQTSVNLWNTTSTTVNFAGAATTLNLGASTGTTTINNDLALGSSKTISTTGSITSNNSTAFIAGANAISNIALQIPREGAIRNLYNGSNNMYFDVSIGGTTQGAFQFRSSSSYTNVLTMSSTGVTFNTDATVTARTPSLARTAFNSAIDTEITVDEMRFRISNQGGIFPQVIGNTSSRNLAWTGVGAISGGAITQVGSTGTIVASNAWTTLYNSRGMDSAGDTVTVTLQDKALSRIYRITFMRSDNGSTTGYNIIAERLL